VFQRLGRNPSQPKTAGRKGTAPIQGELLLEGVKVVRNDLNETDLEVVTATKSPEAAIVPAQPGVGGESARVAWRRMATRLFGSRRT
jgi:hypothetical protein